MKTSKRKKTGKISFTGYTDAPPKIEKEMIGAVLVKDFLPSPGELQPKAVTEKERQGTLKAWKRYRIKDHERGHRKQLAETLKEPTTRLDTSIILPTQVYNWIGMKRNKAAFIREIMIKSYKNSEL